jgi:D-serine deaminase-like pyridoxal phosphate-dependent protein
MANAVGKMIQDLDTPALLLDKAAMERNLWKMAEFFADKPAKLRPHFKNHKCTALAKRQLAAGSAVGMTCAKLGEAEVLVEAGIDNVLIANQVVGAGKLERLAALARRANIWVAVDTEEHIRAIGEAATRAGSTVGVLVEVDIGMGRCGVQPGEPALQLARKIVATPGVRFNGIQAYEGNHVYNPDRQERGRLVRASLDLAVQTKTLIERAGIEVGVISGGASSTYDVTGQTPGYLEVQAGTYATMDWVYHNLASEFEIAMSVLARVISRPAANRAVLDVGLKGVGHEFGSPKIKGHLDSAAQLRLSEEHCTVIDGPVWQVGSAVEIIPSHACTTCNLYRQFLVHENGRVVDVWPIEGSGRME